jgi:FkbM family methyltransferase
MLNNKWVIGKSFYFYNTSITRLMIKQALRKLIPNRVLNYIKKALGVPTQENSLIKLKRLGFRPKYCLDIGAYTGLWTEDFKQIFPECDVLMVEGQLDKEPLLSKVKSQYRNVDYEMCLLGATEEMVTFNIYETASSVLKEHNVTNAKVEKRLLNKLDTITAKRSYVPDFIKIDTQGFELEILKGGENTLAAAEFVLLEVSFLDIYINCPLAADVIGYMNSKGFVIYDICTLMYRPLDKTLYQADILFAKGGSELRKDKRWI